MNIEKVESTILANIILPMPWYQQLNPRHTDKTMMRIRAIIIPNTINLIFMFLSHIFLLIWVPCVLKSCAWNPIKIENENTNLRAKNMRAYPIPDFFETKFFHRFRVLVKLTCDRRFSVLSTKISILSPRSRTWKRNKYS